MDETNVPYLRSSNRMGGLVFKSDGSIFIDRDTGGIVLDIVLQV